MSNATAPPVPRGGDEEEDEDEEEAEENKGGFGRRESSGSGEEEDSEAPPPPPPPPSTYLADADLPPPPDQGERPKGPPPVPLAGFFCSGEIAPVGARGVSVSDGEGSGSCRTYLHGFTSVFAVIYDKS